MTDWAIERQLDALWKELYTLIGVELAVKEWDRKGLSSELTKTQVDVELAEGLVEKWRNP